MNRESLDKYCERGILGLVLAILIYTPLAFGGCPQVPVGSRLDLILVNPFLVVLGIVPVILALWAARLWINAHPQLLWPPICWAVVAFAVYAIIRYFTADIEYVARLEMIQVLTYAFLFLVIVNNLHRQESARIIALSFADLRYFAMHRNDLRAALLSGFTVLEKRYDEIWCFGSNGAFALARACDPGAGAAGAARSSRRACGNGKYGACPDECRSTCAV